MLVKDCWQFDLLTTSEQSSLHELQDALLWKNGSILQVYLIGGDLNERSFLKNRLMEWERYANITFDFVETLRNEKQIRVEFNRNRDNRSQIGTRVGKSELFTMKLDLSRHRNSPYDEHAIGLRHEHQRHYIPFEFDTELAYKDRKKEIGVEADDLWMETNITNIQKIWINQSSFHRFSIMAYKFPANIARDRRNPNMPGLLHDVPRSFVLSLQDKFEITNAYPKPIGGTYHMELFTSRHQMLSIFTEDTWKRLLSSGRKVSYVYRSQNSLRSHMLSQD